MVRAMEILNSLEDFHKLHEAHFKDDYPETSLHNISEVKSIRNGETLVAAGLIKVLGEAIIVTNQDLAKRVRLEGIDMLVGQMVSWCRRYRVNQVHAFVKPEFASTLTKRYGFTKVEDVPLVLNVEV